MEWSDEEETPRRSGKKVRLRVREVISRGKQAAAAAAVAAARAFEEDLVLVATPDEVLSIDSGDTRATNGSVPPYQASERRLGGSVRNARAGIEKRKQQEASHPSSCFRTSLTSHSFRASELTMSSCRLAPCRSNVRSHREGLPLIFSNRRRRGPRG